MTAWIRNFIALGALCILALSGAQAADYPVKPVRIVVPYSPGGESDVFARTIADGLTRELGQPFIVENKPGAGGVVAASAAMAAPADGHTLYYATESMYVLTQVANAYNHKPNPIDAKKEFIPVTMLADIPIVLSIGVSIPARNMQEFVSYAKANPGKLNYGSNGVGTTTHLGGEMLKLAGGFDAVHIPYKGTGDQMNGVMNGQIQFVFSSVTAAQTFAKQGRMKVIAVAGPARVPQIPDVPTMSEQGYPSVALNSWHGIAVRTGTDKSIIDALARQIQKIAAMPDVVQKLTPTGLTPVASTPDQFSARVDSSFRKWTDVLNQSKVKID